MYDGNGLHPDKKSSDYARGYYAGAAYMQGQKNPDNWPKNALIKKMADKEANKQMDAIEASMIIDKPNSDVILNCLADAYLSGALINWKPIAEVKGSKDKEIRCAALPIGNKWVFPAGYISAFWDEKDQDWYDGTGNIISRDAYMLVPYFEDMGFDINQSLELEKCRKEIEELNNKVNSLQNKLIGDMQAQSAGVYSETILQHVWVGARLRMNKSCIDDPSSIYRYSFWEWLEYAKYAQPDLFKYNHDEFTPKFHDWVEQEGWEEHIDGTWSRLNVIGDRGEFEYSSKDELFRSYLKDLPRLAHPQSPTTGGESEAVAILQAFCDACNKYNIETLVPEYERAMTYLESLI